MKNLLTIQIVKFAVIMLAAIALIVIRDLIPMPPVATCSFAIAMFCYGAKRIGFAVRLLKITNTLPIALLLALPMLANAQSGAEIDAKVALGATKGDLIWWFLCMVLILTGLITWYHWETSERLHKIEKTLEAHNAHLKRVLSMMSICLLSYVPISAQQSYQKLEKIAYNQDMVPLRVRFLESGEAELEVIGKALPLIPVRDMQAAVVAQGKIILERYFIESLKCIYQIYYDFRTPMAPFNWERLDNVTRM